MAVAFEVFPRAGRKAWKVREALGISPAEFTFIGQNLNDSDMDFLEIADVIEETIFNK